MGPNAKLPYRPMGVGRKAIEWFILKLFTSIEIYNIGRNLTKGFLDCQEKGCTWFDSSVGFFKIFHFFHDNTRFPSLSTEPFLMEAWILC